MKIPFRNARFFIRYYEKHCGGSHAEGAQSPQERSIALQKK